MSYSGLLTAADLELHNT